VRSRQRRSRVGTWSRALADRLAARDKCTVGLDQPDVGGIDDVAGELSKPKTIYRSDQIEYHLAGAGRIGLGHSSGQPFGRTALQEECVVILVPQTPIS